jgi:lipoprotein-releasing system permease protein
MPYELFLALRYLYSHKRRRIARITTIAAITGVACGVAALIVALSLSNGFRDEMRDKILRGTAHITIIRPDGKPMDNWQRVAAEVKGEPGVVSVYPTSYDGALLSGPTGSAYCVLRGVDVNSADVISNLQSSMVEGNAEESLKNAALAETEGDHSASMESSEIQARSRNERGPDLERFSEIPSEAAIPSVVIGAELANRTGLQLGSTATLVSTESTITPLGIAPRYRRIKVGGIFRSGLYEYDSTWVYLPLTQSSVFAGRPAGAASYLSVVTSDIYNVSRISASIKERLGNQFTTIDWQEANRPLFSALALERKMGFFIVGLIILIAALNITSTLVLVVIERRTDIAILGAMGARPASIITVFMVEGAAVGLIGSISGICIGLLSCFAGNYFKLVSLPSDVYSVGHVPFHPHFVDVVMAGLVAFTLSLIATIYPSMAAARMRPVEGLKA